MAAKGTSALKGAGVGASIGSAVPVIGTAIGAAVGAAIGTVTSFFTSNKHYNLYYWDPVSFSWIFALEGHPNEIKKLAKSYAASGIKTETVRNKNGSGVPPTKPPAGVTASAPSGFNPWLLAGIAGAGLLAFVLLKKRR